ncbi:MAG: hypothetical protein WC319_05075 [Candidatus Paceibacterota bacterium]|jgi:hypothetical protein
MKFHEINFEIGKSCSAGLNSAIEAMGWKDQDTFCLPIKNGPVFNLMEKIIPNCTCLLHIGCSEDNRAPSFEHRIRHRNSEHEVIEFSYRRVVYLRSCWRNDWFRDNNKNRDLIILSKALSDPREYLEEISLFLTIKPCDDENFMQRVGLIIFFRDNQLYQIKDLDYVQEIFKSTIKGFHGSIIDLENGPLKQKKGQFLNDLNHKEWEEILKKCNLSIDDFIIKIYRLFQETIPQFKEKMKMRESLF